MPPSGAFHHVDAKQSFARPPNASTFSTSPPAQPKKVDWPQPVRRYVQRAFMPEHSIPGIDRSEMEKKLKETITQANEQDALHTIDWDARPLPQELILQERTRAYPAASPSTWAGSMSGLAVGDAGAPVTTTSKKRKSSDLYASHTEDDLATAPWHKTNRRNLLEDRMTFPENGHGNGDSRPPPIKGPSKYHHANAEKRQKRFDHTVIGAQATKHPWVIRAEALPAPEVAHGPVEGRCQVLEKKYFRLTAAPNPDTVRPLSVLQQTLELLKKKWKKEKNYGYVCDQFKSLRQDLTVQHIKNEFTVSVYEIHARIALENHDLGEYNQCQTQLRALHLQNLGGHPMEFKAYRILYFLYTRNQTDMNDVLADLTPAEKKDDAVKHALGARSALALGNYHQFFRLFLDTPNMGSWLMDMFVDRERLAALANICKAYKKDVTIRFITEELGFESDGHTVQFLYDHMAAKFLIHEPPLRLDTLKLHKPSNRDDSNDGDDNDDSLDKILAWLLFEAGKVEAFRKVDLKGQI
ncbi:MAG: Leukocyte receptor cluster (LRC) member 8 [Thelocarpon superellum]|nr:MAG: Leukocyte receptor cluster (LRC) member 8 [Thelocarpon superellum]